MSRINIFETLKVNFQNLPFSQAIKLPILIYGNIDLNIGKNGSIQLEGKMKRGFLRIGVDYGYFNSPKLMSTFLKIDGTLLVKEDVHLGLGVSVHIEDGAKLYIKEKVIISDQTKIKCYKYVEIGNNTNITFEATIFDTNFHYLMDLESKTKAPINSSIIIGDNNWIGFRTSIMKGTLTPNGCVVASNSLLNKDYREQGENILLAGRPAKCMRKNISRVWNFKQEKEVDNLFIENDQPIQFNKELIQQKY